MNTACNEDDTGSVINFEDALRAIPAVATLPAAVFADLTRYVHEELELRIGHRLCDGLTDEQLEQFESIVEWEAAHPESAQGGTGPAAAWLESHRPDYRHVVRTVFHDLLAETRILLETTVTPERSNPVAGKPFHHQ